MRPGESTIPLVSYYKGWSSQGSTGELTLVLKNENSWLAGQTGNHPDPESELCFGASHHRLHLWSQGVYECLDMQNQSYRHSLTQENRIFKRSSSIDDAAKKKEPQTRPKTKYNEHLQVTIQGLKDCLTHCVTLQFSQQDCTFPFLKLFYFYPGVGGGLLLG